MARQDRPGFTVIDNVQAHEAARLIIRAHIIGAHRTLADPTCGVRNRMISPLVPWLRAQGVDYRPCDINPGNWACRQGYPACVCDVFEADSLPRASAWWYDPPYLPYTGGDRRAEDYAIDRERDVAEIRRYYSEQVARNFEARGARLIVLKGSDFYWPTSSNRLYLFLRDIVSIPRGWRPTALYVYRYYSRNVPRIQVGLGVALARRGYRRPVIVHTYFLVIEKD